MASGSVSAPALFIFFNIALPTLYVLNFYINFKNMSNSTDRSEKPLTLSTILGIHYISGFPNTDRALYDFIYSLTTFREPILFSTIPEEMKIYKFIDNIVWNNCKKESC